MLKSPIFSTAKQQESAILVGLITQKQNAEQTKEYLDELEFLATTAGVITKRVFTQRLERPDSRTFVGKGKLEEIKVWLIENPVDSIIFDDDLTAPQVRNLEMMFQDIKILDRSLLILNIFSQRAQTDQAKRQVELAQYQYLLPRLTRMWTHLSRQKGGIGMRGPGEKELETDKRIVKDRIAFLKDKLEKIDKQSFTRRKERSRLVRVALVGYTNVGKSTLMRRLAKTEVFAENKLFATIDSTVRKVVLGNIPFLLTDTVGFIRKLPTQLIESFKSTLDEIREADILIHVVDISHPSFEEQIEVVNVTLAEIGASEKSMILVFNKLDLFKPESEDNLDEHLTTIDENLLQKNLDRLKNSYLKKNTENVVFISAEHKENLADLRDVLIQKIQEKHFLIYPNWDPTQNPLYDWQGVVQE
ncbi:GTP-binding proten HflX [Emticicia oligotrophica DSM 17448]|uniref:GTPase HflX n=1 Tax=Emticicia oligotrophica (strain DSM 17448 / CIP 109782 / MTCC 6937 / GPTSA100-15) TaxID=929562 RepID=A0ABN4AMP7_EMTOG|nr:GTPase HflX [Emticicia oligotrophica]AFK03628.1 GTP-binding proten HflX [Emticicia oligotrophica DSM 17448]